MELEKARKLLQQTEAFHKRLESLKTVWDTQIDYPFKLQILGFPIMDIQSKEELDGRIKELEDCLLIEVKERGTM